MSAGVYSYAPKRVVFHITSSAMLLTGEIRGVILFYARQNMPPASRPVLRVQHLAGIRNRSRCGPGYEQTGFR